MSEEICLSAWSCLWRASSQTWLVCAHKHTQKPGVLGGVKVTHTAHAHACAHRHSLVGPLFDLTMGSPRTVSSPS